MKMFTFDPADYRQAYADNGWVHIPGGIDPEFLAALRAFIAENRTQSLDRWALGDKTQLLYEFPESVDYPGELFDTIAAMCGLNRPSMTLSERHIKLYEDDADPEPHAHKDRYASQVSVGLSIDIPAGSQLVLYPHDHVGVNYYNTAADFRNSLHPHELPEVVVKTAREVVIDDKAGDVVAFRGSALWHLRRNAASATNMYLKLNDFEADPLGEDPVTPVRRAQTLERVTNGAAIGDLVAVSGRRLDFVSRHYTRDWDEVLQANIFGERPFGLSPVQYKLLQAADGSKTVAQLASKMGDALNGRSVEEEAKVLAERGALDLV
jgi:hypothetical protein